MWIWHAIIALLWQMVFMEGRTLLTDRMLWGMLIRNRKTITIKMVLSVLQLVLPNVRLPIMMEIQRKAGPFLFLRRRILSRLINLLNGVLRIYSTKIWITPII